MSDKTKNYDCNLILMEDDKIVNNVSTICNVFNDYFLTMTQGIGEDDTGAVR